MGEPDHSLPPRVGAVLRRGGGSEEPGQERDADLCVARERDRAPVRAPLATGDGGATWTGQAAIERAGHETTLPGDGG